MGYMRHHAIVITSDDEKAIFDLRQFIVEAVTPVVSDFDSPVEVTEITGRAVNGYRSFMVAPDGSKEGWAESDIGEKIREDVIKTLNLKRYEDGSSPFDWAEIQFGDDEHDNRMLRASGGMKEDAD